MPSGQTTVNFGAYPGSVHARLTITGQSAILSTSVVEAWCPATLSSDHSADEHAVSGPRCVAGGITPGTGFTIDCFAPEALAMDPVWSGAGRVAQKDKPPMLQGIWNVNWAWA